MKYPSLKNKKVKTYSVTAFNDGLCQNADISDCSFAESENVYNSEGRITARKGLVPNGQHYTVPDDEYITKRLCTTETVFNKDGRSYNIAYMIASDNISCEYVKTYLVNGKTGYINIGEITFRRITSSDFYRPTNIYFIVANPTKGAGIYAFVTRTSNGKEIYEVYEATAEFDDWRNVTAYAYTPTIYANGRGTLYAAAQEFDDRLDYPEPVEPEQRNLLNSRFRAYYSSDRISHTFKLPLSNLDELGVTCKIYSDAENYTEWIIDINQNAAVADFQGEQVIFACNRQTGYFWFSKNGGAFSIPISQECPYNNIVITAHKEITNGNKMVISSKNATVYNSRVYVCGNTENPNEVFSARLTNPLYFPKNAKAIVGDSTSAVTALGVQSGKLIAFKAGGIYKINVSKNSTKSQNVPIFDTETDFGKDDVFETEMVHTSIGCDCPDTLRLCGGRFMWLNSNGAVYTLATTTYGKQNNIYEISSPISKTLDEIPLEAKRNAFAIDGNGYYIIVCGSMALVMDYRVSPLGYHSVNHRGESRAENVAWYVWQLPKEAVFTSGFYGEGSMIINAGDPQNTICYILSMSGSADKLLFTDGENIIEKEYPINCSLSTKSFDFDTPHVYKYINAVYITANSDGPLEITVQGDTAFATKRIRLPKMMGTVKITPLIPNTVTTKISIKSQSELSLYGMRFGYTDCSTQR